MRSRRNNQSIFASPVLIGAVTSLVVVIAVFLAYNANKGLPFLPTKLVHVQLRNGAELVKGNDIRVGGFRVGIVSDLQPRRFADGTVGALASLKIDSRYGPLPIDSVAVIRPRSALGLKYVELQRGSSPRLLGDGATLPLSQSLQEPELDQVYGIFDAKTRAGAQTNLTEFGNALSGRGVDLNATIRQLPTTFGALTPVMRNLADPSTQLSNLFKQLELTAGTVAPLSSANARLFTTMANTWAAVSRDPRALKDTISKQPPTYDAGTASLRTQIPFLRDTAAWSRDLNAASAELRGALPTLNGALRVAVPVTQRSTGALYGNLEGAMAALRDLVQAPTTNAALRGLTATVTSLQPQLRYLGPFVTVCNYWNYWWTFVGEHFSEPDPTGTVERALLNGAANQTNGVDSQGAVKPANGKGVLPGQYGSTPQYLHDAVNGAAITSNGLADCESGQRGYIHGGPVANKFGDPSANIELDAHPPLGYRHGSTFARLVNGVGQGLGPDKVPAGETFTRNPGGLGAVAP